MTESDRNLSTLRRMALKGSEYREEYELEYFDETTTIFLKPLKDSVFLEILEDMDDVIDDEEFGEMMEEEIDLDDEEAVPDEEEFDPEFVNIMRKAAKLGIDHEKAGESEEGIEEILDMMVGGVSIEIGAEVMEITSNLQDAERFRRV